MVEKINPLISFGLDKLATIIHAIPTNDLIEEIQYDDLNKCNLGGEEINPLISFRFDNLNSR